MGVWEHLCGSPDMDGHASGRHDETAYLDGVDCAASGSGSQRRTQEEGALRDWARPRRGSDGRDFEGEDAEEARRRLRESDFERGLGQCAARPSTVEEPGRTRSGGYRASGSPHTRGLFGREGERGGEDAARRGRGGARVLSGRSAVLMLWAVAMLAQLQLSGSWITLSDKGYSVKHTLIAQAGVKVSGPVRVNGLMISRPVASLQCNPSRRGALRWNAAKFEACDGETDWRALTFCSRSCDIDTSSVPCGLPVKNTCDKSCQQLGSGLNMRQCILNVGSTACGKPVMDLCSNACGLAGQFQCEDNPAEFGLVALRSVEKGTTGGNTSFHFKVGSVGVRDNSMFLSFEKNGVNEEMIRFKRVLEHETSGYPSVPLGKAVWNHTSSIKEEPFGTVQGMEIAKPDNKSDTTTRVSMYTELTGGYIRLGHKDGAGVGKASHVFLDGTVDKECPFLFNAGNYEEHDIQIGKASYFTKVCLESSESNVELKVPDASGVILTQGNEEDLRSVPGLRGRDVMVHTSTERNMLHINRPEAPRINCSSVQCTEPQDSMDGGVPLSSCAGMAFATPPFDAFRLLYDLSAPELGVTWSNQTKAFVSLMGELHGTSPEAKEILAVMKEQGASRRELTRHFLSLLFIELGMQDIALPDPLSEVSTAALLRVAYNDFPIDAEQCFACCCGAYPAAQGSGGRGETNAELSVCRDVKYEPKFCLNAPIGSGVGEKWDVHLPECKVDSDCEINGWGGSPCGIDYEKILCAEGDLAWVCWDVSIRSNLTTTVNFKEPAAYRILTVPAASGTVVSTDNLEDITSLGLQSEPIVTRSSVSTTTTISFEDAADATNNTLYVPNAADGMLLSTGNLEDVTVASGYMTGLSVKENVHVRGSLRFDGSPQASGLLQPPSDNPSEEYVRPHSLLPSAPGRPAHIRFRVSDSTTVLEFEPADEGVTDHNLRVRPVSGTMVSTGNLEAITAQSGSMTSLGVDLLSYLQGGVIVGSRGVTQLMVQGNQGDTMTFNSTHPKSKTGDDFSTTVIGFDIALGGANKSIHFGAQSGTVITTGNLPDIFEFSGQTIDVSDEVHLRGPVTIGEGTASRAAGLTPVMFTGHLEGSIMHRQTPPKSKESLIGEVPFPYTWGRHLGTACAGVPGPVRDVPTEAWPGAADKFAIDPNRVSLIQDVEAGCRAKCEALPGCGVLTIGRYFRARLLNMKNFPDSLDYLGTALRKIGIDPTSNQRIADACYPGFDDLTSLYEVDYLYDLSRYPLVGSHWLTAAECQGAIATTVKEFGAQWGAAAPLLNDMQVMPVRCNGTLVADSSAIDLARGCEVLLRSHMTASYLRGAPQSECIDQAASAASGGSACARWATTPSLWTLLPYTAPLPAFTPTLPTTAVPDLGTEGFFRIRRDAVCVEVAQGEAQTLSCGEGDVIASVSFAHWGKVEGLCGAYQAGTSCPFGGLSPTTVSTYCKGAGGCRISVSDGYLSVRSVATGATSPPTACFMEGSRVAVTAECATRVFLGGSKPTKRPHFMVFTEAAVASHGTAPSVYGPLETVFHIHSDAAAPSESHGDMAGNGGVNALTRDCWLAKTDAFTCEPSADPESDVSLFMRYQTTKLDFAEPTEVRTQFLPDASGTIITSGNLHDVTNLQGLTSVDTFVFRHGNQMNAPTTTVDFASIGTAPDSRSDGALPAYATDSPGEVPHPTPVGANRRITFPDATGTVITTGNIDDLVFKSISLRGLVLDGEAEFMNSIGNKAIVNFKNSSRVAGCMNFAAKMDAAAGHLVTQLCEEKATQENTMLLPDASGVIITTGNLLNLPSARFQGSKVVVGGDVALEGDLTLGTPKTAAIAKIHAFLDGDVGLTFAAPIYSPAETRDNVLRLNTPHMGGVDIAARHYLTSLVKHLPVDVQSVQSFRETVPGTERVNQSTCNRVMTAQRVHDAHGLGYFLHRSGVAQRTLMSGTPYAAAEIAGNQTYPACFSSVTNSIVCHGPSPSPCGCGAPGERMVVTWRQVGSELVRARTSACARSMDPGCAFDGDVTTFYESEYLSREVPVNIVAILPPQVANFMAYNTPLFNRGSTGGRCVVGLEVATGVGASWVRVFPQEGKAHMMKGGVLQAGRGQVVNGVVQWFDLHPFVDPPKEKVWNDIKIGADKGPGGYTHLRYLGPACGTSGFSPDDETGQECRCDVFEWEWHQGMITQRFHPLQEGQRSYFIDEARVFNSSTAAMVLKCAAQQWYPGHLRTDVQELMVPETSGTLLTSGNLQDVTKEAGTITSIRVADGAQFGGSTVLGFPGTETEMAVHSVLSGRFPLAFASGGNIEAASLLTVPDLTLDARVLFPATPGGTIVTTAAIPALSGDMQVVSRAELRGAVSMTADILIGDELYPSSLLLNSHIAGGFPLTFRGGANANVASHRMSLGLESPSADRTLVLPDVTGTVLTTGNMPQVLEESTLVGSTRFTGGAKFTGANVVFGQPDETIKVEINSAIGGSIPLVFEGKTADRLTLSLAVEEPTANNVLSLPDVSGTVITTGNFPESLDNLHVVGDLLLDATFTIAGDASHAAVLGHPHQRSKLQIHSVIAGRYPLVFGEEGGGNDLGETTTFEVTPPSGDNIITFPDTSGTVITTGNIPEKVVVSDDYNIHARSLLIVAPSVAMGHQAAEPTHRGSFVFTDASEPASQGDGAEGFSSWGKNSFNVRATGGARLVTGYTARGKEIGVVLESLSSAWSVLSDHDTKRILSTLSEQETIDVLEKLASKVPISTWTYEGHTTRHMGPMAQDLHAAFQLGESEERISSIDADGVAMAAAQGLRFLQNRAEETLAALSSRVARNASRLRRDRQELARNNARIDEEAALIALLEARLGLAPVGAVAAHS